LLKLVISVKLVISLYLNILGNIWDNVSTQVNQIYNIVLVVFGYFNPKILHIVPLNNTKISHI